MPSSAPRVAVLNTAQPVAFGNFHVGDAAPSQALSITNNVPNDGFSEALNATIGSPTGGVTTNGGSFNLLAPGATNTASLSVGIDTASAGNKNGTATLGFATDGTGSSGLAAMALPSQNVNVTGAVYRLAAPSAATPNPINFGVVHVGDTVSQALSISNTAAADGFSEALNASFSGTTGAASASGVISLLAAGANDTVNLLVGVGTATAGNKSGTATLGLTSDGTGTSGLGTTALSDQLISLQAQVNEFAQPLFVFDTGAATLTMQSATAFTLDFGQVDQNTGTFSASVFVRNLLLDPVFQDALGGTFTTGSVADFGLTGFAGFTGLAPGGDTASSGVLFDSAMSLGLYLDTLSLAPDSENASSTTGLPAIQLTLRGEVVPEPSTALLAVLGLGALAARRRRRA